MLGAGRLLDFSHPLAAHFEHLLLADADPLCLPFWRAAHPRHEPVIADLTGCLAEWNAQLPHGASWRQTLDHVRSRRAKTPQHAWLQDCDAILSLNLLSQLPMGWLERVEACLVRRFGAAYLRQHEEEWLAAVEPGARSLIDAHLAMLDASRASQILVITDLTFVEYRGGTVKYSRRRASPPPLQWKDGAFTGDPTLRCDLCPALYGLEKPALPHYREAWSEHWLWHIQPLGTESAGSGALNLVGAFCFERVDATLR